jgi:ATP-dependent exoDNAse (exonuclease V) alpha subunit
MATPIYRMGMVGRGPKYKHKSAVDRAAYLNGEKIEHNGEVFDYSEKQGEIVFAQTFAPEGLPEWVDDWKTLWRKVEQSEKHKHAQLARSLYFALPRELTREQQIAFVKDYVQVFVSDGMIVTCAIHEKTKDNPHCHILIPMRLLQRDGKWAKKSRHEYVLDEQGERVLLESGKYKTRKIDLTDWNNPDNFEKWRTLWEVLIDTHLKRAGFERQIRERKKLLPPETAQAIEQMKTTMLKPKKRWRPISIERKKLKFVLEQQREKKRQKEAYVQWIQQKVALKKTLQQLKSEVKIFFADEQPRQIEETPADHTRIQTIGRPTFVRER